MNIRRKDTLFERKTISFETKVKWTVYPLGGMTQPWSKDYAYVYPYSERTLQPPTQRSSTLLTGALVHWVTQPWSSDLPYSKRTLQPPTQGRSTLRAVALSTEVRGIDPRTTLTRSGHSNRHSKDVLHSSDRALGPPGDRSSITQPCSALVVDRLIAALLIWWIFVAININPNTPWLWQNLDYAIRSLLNSMDVVL